MIEVLSYKDFEDAYRWVIGSPEARQFRTFCIDSASEIAERCLEAEKKLSKDPRRAYGEMQDKMLIGFKAFRDLPGVNVYFSCKEGMIQDGMTGANMFGPWMPGTKLGPAMPYLFDEIFRLEKYRAADNKEYPVLRTTGGVQHEGKDRSGALDEFEHPNLTAIFDKIANRKAA